MTADAEQAADNEKANLDTVAYEDQTAFKLWEAMQQPGTGCPICHMVHTGVVNYLDGISYESVNDFDIRRELRKSLGYCAVHGQEWLRLQDTLGTALIYRDVLSHVLGVLQAHVAPASPTNSENIEQSAETGRDGFIGMLRKMLGKNREGSDVGRTLSMALKPSAPCPVCEYTVKSENSIAGSFAKGLAHSEFREAYRQHEVGLCLPHFRLVIRRLPKPQLLNSAMQIQEALLTQTCGELAEVSRKSDYRYMDEPTGREFKAPARSVEQAWGTLPTHLNLPDFDGQEVKMDERPINRPKTDGDRDGTADLTRDELARALREPGCPVCSFTRTSVNQYLEWTAYEKVNDTNIREVLRRSIGYCASHGREWLALRTVLGTAIIYEDVLRPVILTLQNARGQLAQSDSAQIANGGIGTGDSILSKLRAILGNGSGGIQAGRDLADLFEPTAPCPACKYSLEVEQRAVQSFSTALGERDFIELFREHEMGLCLPHLRAVLSRLDQPGLVRTLVQEQESKLKATIADLSEVLRKSDYRNTGEPRGDEFKTPARSVEQAAGNLATLLNPVAIGTRQLAN